MRIDYKNIDMLEESGSLYVHDAIFSGFSYNYDENLISFEAENHYENSRLKFSFINVLGVKILCADFWGSSNRLHICESGKDYNYPLLNELKERDQKDGIPKERISTLDNAVEIIFTLVSGDCIDIVCEYLEFDTMEMGCN